jgi:hypothetical protein
MHVIKGNCRFVTVLLLCFLALVTPHPVSADPGIDYPVVLTTPQDLASFAAESIDPNRVAKTEIRSRIKKEAKEYGE